MAVPNQAERNLLKALLTFDLVGTRIKLAQNNPAHADDDVVLTDLTEADFDGYAALDTSAWDLSSLATNGDGVAEFLSPTLTWTAGAGISGAQTIYGMWIEITINGTDYLLAWWLRFADPFTFAVPDQFLEKTIDFKLRQLVP